MFGHDNCQLFMLNSNTSVRYGGEKCCLGTKQEENHAFNIANRLIHNPHIKAPHLGLYLLNGDEAMLHIIC